MRVRARLENKRFFAINRNEGVRRDGMRLEYENGAILVENEKGRRWQLKNVEKPPLKFQYDALIFNKEQALRRIGSNVHALTDSDIKEIASFVGRQQPPPGATMQRQVATDLKAFAYGLINAAVAQLEYDSLLDVQITGRAGSTDLYAEEARRVLGFVDTIWNAYYALTAQIDDTPEDELKTIREYANMLPMMPAKDYFVTGSGAPRGAVNHVALVAEAAPVSDDADLSGERSPVSLETPAPGAADFANIIDRAFVFDDFLASTQLHLLEQWALKTPHWMLTNTSLNEKAVMRHRLWGASYIEAWQCGGWAGLPPVLCSAIVAVFKKLDVTVTRPEYIGLNGQSRGQDAAMHADCEPDSPDDLSVLIYIGEDTTGDLHLYDKKNRHRLLHRVAFRPNRVIAFDGSVPHQAFAPEDDKFRMSIIVRGKYKVGYTPLI